MASNTSLKKKINNVKRKAQNQSSGKSASKKPSALRLLTNKKSVSAKKLVKNDKKSALKSAGNSQKASSSKAGSNKKAVNKAVIKKIPAKKLAIKSSAKPAVKASLLKKIVNSPTQSAAKTSPVQSSSKPAVNVPTDRFSARSAARAKHIQAQQAIKNQPVKLHTAKEQKMLYKVGNFVVYPTHGVGKILAEETQNIGEIEIRMLVIHFDRDKMTLRVPMHRAAAAGLRPISNNDKIKEMYATLKSKAKISRGMWSRRAQEYEAKINSGNILLIAEVVRDLHQNVDQSERSYSERMIYENALNRVVGEVAAAEGTDTKIAYDKLMKLLRAKVAASVKEAA